MTLTPSEVAPTGDIAAPVTGKRRRRGLPLTMIIGGLIVAFIVLAALISFIWTPYDPIKVSAGSRFLRPSGEHWLGTDALGRDVFSNLMAGSRITLLVGLISVGVGASVGVPIGVAAAMTRGIIATVLEKIIDLLLTFPALLLAIAFGSIWGSSTETAMLAIGIATAPAFARLSRAGTLQVMSTEYVVASRVAGHGRFYIILRHVLPNISGLLLVQASVVYGIAVLAESGLSFLGFAPRHPPLRGGLCSSRHRPRCTASPFWPYGPPLRSASRCWDSTSSATVYVTASILAWTTGDERHHEQRHRATGGAARRHRTRAAGRRSDGSVPGPRAGARGRLHPRSGRASRVDR